MKKLITIDGPCASGKTTLAEKLGLLLHAPVIHTDDFVIPSRAKDPRASLHPRRELRCGEDRKRDSQALEGRAARSVPSV